MDTYEQSMDKTIEDASRRIADSITPTNAMAFTDGQSTVRSLTEAIIYHAEQMRRVSDSLDNIANAIRDHTDSGH